MVTGLVFSKNKELSILYHEVSSRGHAVASVETTRMYNMLIMLTTHTHTHIYICIDRSRYILACKCIQIYIDQQNSWRSQTATPQTLNSKS